MIIDSRTIGGRTMIDETISLKAGEVAVVGYGSLLSREIIGQTLGHDYDGPFVLCHISGWRRSWDVTMPNAAFYYIEDEHRVYPPKILYLNVRRYSNTLMNCSVFVVGPGECDAMNGREWIFDPTIVTSDLRGVSIEGGDAMMYVGKSDHALQSSETSHDVALRRSFLRGLFGVLNAEGPSVRDEWQRTTDPIPEHLLVDDRLDDSRPNPWEAAGEAFPLSHKQKSN
jgi:hypothetical protein